MASRHFIVDPTDPNAMTLEQRRDELATILARGVIRLFEERHLTDPNPPEKPPFSSRNCLEVPGGTCPDGPRGYRRGQADHWLALERLCVLRPDETRRQGGKACVSNHNLRPHRRSFDVRFIRARAPRRAWSKSLIRSTPNVRAARRLSPARKPRAGCACPTVTTTAVSPAETWIGQRSSGCCQILTHEGSIAWSCTKSTA